VTVAISDDATAPAATALATWADSARQATQIATQLARTPFVPASLRDRDPAVTAANITAVILTGQEMGLAPMAALRSVDIIQGTPALRANALRGILQAHGHAVWVEESTATRAIVCGRRAGSDEPVQRSVWTMDRAKALGLTGKDNWRRQPTAMLVARGTAEVARWIASDALLGLPYVAEEVADDGAETAVDATADAAPLRRTARRRTVPTERPAARPSVAADPEPDPEPEMDDPETLVPAAAVDGKDSGGDEAPPEPDEDGQLPLDGGPDHDGPPEPAQITMPQLRALQAGFKEAGITDRADRLNIANAITGRTLSSASQLTVSEASTILDRLAYARDQADPIAYLMGIQPPDDEGTTP
jgi:hypothetical protein